MLDLIVVRHFDGIQQVMKKPSNLNKWSNSENQDLPEKNVNVLVETAEKWKPYRKPKKEKITKLEPSKRLDTWIKR